MHPVRLLRNRLGLTQRELALRLNLAQNTISDAEKGAVGRELALSIYDSFRSDFIALGISLEEVLLGKQFTPRERRKRERDAGAAA